MEHANNEMAGHCGPNNYHDRPEGEEAIGTDTFTREDTAQDQRRRAVAALEHGLDHERPAEHAHRHGVARPLPVQQRRGRRLRPGWPAAGPAAVPRRRARPPTVRRRRATDRTRHSRPRLKRRGSSSLRRFRRPPTRSISSSGVVERCVADLIDAVHREACGPPPPCAGRARCRGTTARGHTAAPARGCARASSRTGARRPRAASGRASPPATHAVAWRSAARAASTGLREPRILRRVRASRSISAAIASSAPPLPSARSVSSESTLVVPSQIGSTCASASMRGSPVSST